VNQDDNSNSDCSDPTGQPRLPTEREKFFTPLLDKEHLQLWIEKFLGFTLPDFKVTEWATSTPLDFVYDVYRAIMDGQPLNILAISGRDASKTVSLSVIDLLSISHDLRSAIHFGMVTKQAARARSYIDKYVSKIEFLREAMTKENSTELFFNLNGNEVGLEILPCTKKASQGGHSACVSWDEIGSSVEPALVAGYRDSSGVPGASSKGKPAVTIKISSRHASDSLVEMEIKKAEQRNEMSGPRLKIVKWTTIDCTEQCLPERCGTQDRPLFISTMKGLRYTPEEFAALPERDKEDFQYVTDTKDKCYSCPLVTLCKGKLRYQTSKSVLLRKIDDVITKLNNAGSHTWALSQIMSLMPSPEGRVYTNFSREKHMPGWDAMWERLTGEKPAKPITRDVFVEHAKRTCSLYAGEDFGWTRPSTCVVIAVDGRDNVYVLEAIGRTLRNDPDWVEDIYELIETKYGIQLHAPDPENKSALSLMRNRGLNVVEVDKSAGSVRAGINTIKRFLRVPGTNNETKLFIAPDLVSPADAAFPGLPEELEMYRWPIATDGRILDDKNPEKGNDHFCVAPDSMVTTADGAKTIDKIRLGDRVLCHDGTFSRVTNVMVRSFSGDMNRIHVAGREPLLVTDNHPLLVGTAKRSNAVEDGIRLTGQLRVVRENRNWLIPSEIQTKTKSTSPRPLAIFPTVNDGMRTAIDMKCFLPEYVERNGWLWALHRKHKKDGVTNAKCRPLSRMQEIDGPLAFLLGYFAAEGAKTGNPLTNNFGVRFASHVREVKVDAVIDRVVKRFGVHRAFSDTRGNGKYRQYNSKALYRLFASFGKGTEKRLPEYCLRLPKEETLHLLAGYLFGDGHFGKAGLVVGSVSRELAYEIFYLLTRLGFCPTIKRAIRAGRWKGLGSGGVIGNDQWIVRLKKDAAIVLLQDFWRYPELKEIYQDKKISTREAEISGGHSWNLDGAAFSIIHQMERVPYSGLVYNLEVEGSHSYVVNGIAVHNCDALRYIMYWLFGKQLAQVTFADLPAHLQPPSNLREAMVDQASALTHTQIDQSPQDPAKDPKDPNVPSQGGGLQFRFT
jgi:hypothetical protein